MYDVRLKTWDREEINERIGRAAMLEQMGEEAAELAKAALKLARVLRGENPTPTTKEEAEKDLIAEFTDVQHCAGELKLETDWRQINAKNRRFKQRMDEMVLDRERARIRAEIIEEAKEMGGCDGSDEYREGVGCGVFCHLRGIETEKGRAGKCRNQRRIRRVGTAGMMSFATGIRRAMRKCARST